MAPVRLCAVSKAFEQNVVLHDIDLTVEDREFMVLVGPSGCGKSTLLRLIAGLETVTEGSIYLGDTQINHLPPKARDIAMVFQSYALYPHMSVYENIAFGLRRQQSQRSGIFSSMGHKQRQAIALRVQQVAESLQIDKLLDRKPKELSGGQKQRVALGRAIARNPQAFLMDEPLSNLDAQLRSETRAQIVQLQQQLQTTTIYVTHDQTEAMTMGSRITVLNGGKIQQVDTPLNLYRKPANLFVAGFMGSPPMNFLPVALDANRYLQGEHFSQPVPFDRDSNRDLELNQSYVLGIRPEDLKPCSPDRAHVCGSVQLVEALGAETIVILDIHGQCLRARLSADLMFTLDLTLGAKTYWQFDLNKLYLFDRTTENAVYQPI
ncbi:ABC transporter ATP-binding protein [Tumidithrix elongata RA019]|uniref:ABC transporter ATP-binding protein n=1 Tax=Tumidithrix elongata BACA0141 TaxID=2716417 RepID=A0AAW9PW62_9CYAN|nr:ABC transporter ATP-binding protein [Tumidithrix elongata RA019]